MIVTEEESVLAVNHLIETCKDGEKGYREASEEINHDYYRVVFSEFARQREQHASQLESYVRAFHLEPVRKGSVAGALHRGWMNAKWRIEGKQNDAVIAECLRGEEVALENYEYVLSLNLAEDLRTLLEKQQAEIQHALRRIRSMSV